MSALGGWLRLAANYPAGGVPEGRRHNRITVRIGAVRYRNDTTVILCPAGLYLALAPVPLPGHGPILIPWREIRGSRPATVYWRRYQELIVGEPEVARVAVPQAIWDEAQAYLRL
jgi:hypothetical protein